MATFSDIATSLRVTTMLPLDHKRFSVSELALSNLGNENNLAFTYYDNLKVFCWAEKSEWVWREVVVGDTTIKLLASDFTYPNGVVYPNPGYEGKKYNFHKITPGTDTKIVAGTNISITGNGSSATPYIINNTFTYTPPPVEVPPLEKRNEGAGLGIFLRGRDAASYSNIGLRAFDISFAQFGTNDLGASGESSFAQGEAVTASNYGSVTFGNDARNSGLSSFITGTSLVCAARYSFVSGYGNATTGKANTVLGIGNVVNSAGTTVVGMAANIISNSITTYVLGAPAAKPIFVVGNGVIDDITDQVTSRSDAFIVRNDGVLEAPDMAISAINAGIGRTLVTKEYIGAVLAPIQIDILNVQSQVDTLELNTQKKYKSYVALLSQTTGAPDPIILENDFTGVLLWTKDNPGQFRVTLPAAFPADKTVVFTGELQTDEKLYAVRLDDNVIRVFSRNTVGFTDGLLDHDPIEIRVYN